MTDRWAEVERVCIAALELDPASRAAFLDQACAGDQALRREVDSLLASEPAAAALLDVPAVDAAAEALSTGDEQHWVGAFPGGAAPSGREPLAAGTHLGPYEIDALIAAGGMGEIYRARDTRLRRRVAVKVLPPGFALDPDRLHRFQLEAEAVAALNHPNILAIHDIGVCPPIPGEPDGTPPASAAPPVHYLVTELLEGETLRERIARGPIPVAAALDIALPIARALAAAHDKHIIHRDLKPSNVFLTATGQVKLLDFGIAKIGAGGAADIPNPAAPGDVRTDTNVRLGTVGYMSPEQARGRAIDARTDIFSFGAVLHEMLAGRRVFEGDTGADVLFAILTKEAPPLAGACRDAPPALQNIVSRCLAKQPEDRFQSAHDLVRALTAASRESRGRVRARRLLAPAAILLLFALAGGALYLRPSREQAQATASGVERLPHPRNAIAVLPLQHLSADPALASVAGGLHDELLTQLSKVTALRVTGRTSVMGYQKGTRPLTQLADELGVGTVVEGSVQVANGRLHVSVNLVDTATNQLLWTNHYEGTLDDTFTIQSEIAQRIVAGVGEAIASAERASVAARPTASAEAYRLYLQGREYGNRPGSLRTNLQAAAQLYERALALDPGFALAHAELSRVYGMVYWYRYDPSPARAAREREEAATALRLAPDLPQAHVAMGFAHYFGSLSDRDALAEFELARKALPNDAELWADIGYANRRLGKWKDVATAYGHATELDPRSADNFYDLGGETFTLLHRYAEAVGAYERALSLAPDMHPAALRRALAYLLWKGETEPLREVLAGLPDGADLGAHGSVAAQRAALLFLERDAAGLLGMLEVMRSTDFEGHVFFLPSALYRGWAHAWRGDRAAARAAFESAAARLDAALRDLPGDWRLHVARGFAQAGLGRCKEAIAEARWLQQSDVYRGDAHFGTIAAEGRAQILAQCGSTDAALDEIRRLLPGPSWLSVHTLRLDPRWDPLRADPRFQALMKVHGS